MGMPGKWVYPNQYIQEEKFCKSFLVFSFLTFLPKTSYPFFEATLHFGCLIFYEHSYLDHALLVKDDLIKKNIRADFSK